MNDPIDCSLTLQIGDRMTRLDCNCVPGAEYGASNALMEAMRTRIKDAHTKELAGIEQEVAP
jgi:hypothetical protein